MATTAIQKRQNWTYDDYVTLPDDLNIYEVIDGELFMSPAPTTKHQIVSMNMERKLDNYVKKQDAGIILHAPIDVLLSPHTIVQPDIIFISKGNMSIITEKNIQGSPDLIIEILSPSTIRRDRIIKMKVYAKYHIKNLWLIDPDNQTLEVFELDKEMTYRLVSGIAYDEECRLSLFPDLTISLNELWIR